MSSQSTWAGSPGFAPPKPLSTRLAMVPLQGPASSIVKRTCAGSDPTFVTVTGWKYTGRGSKPSVLGLTISSAALPSKSVPLSSASKDSNSMGRRLVKVMSWVIGPSVEVLTSMSRTPAWKSAPMRSVSVNHAMVPPANKASVVSTATPDRTIRFLPLLCFFTILPPFSVVTDGCSASAKRFWRPPAFYAGKQPCTGRRPYKTRVRGTKWTDSNGTRGYVTGYTVPQWCSGLRGWPSSGRIFSRRKALFRYYTII